MTDPHVFKNGSSHRRRAKRVLSAEEKLQVWLELVSGQCTQPEAAARWGVDPSTIMRIRRVARQGALGALAQSRPGVSAQGEDAELVAARAEIARLEQAVKEQAIELVVLRGKQRSGW
jgi:transposase-like protein